ncbi:hypothetical protein Tcan_12196 [Toxocara canis]|uniref:Uncharacterized protein n=1 Tax=Toxocara canis TaxID=6265 RepID=A0A0B2UMV5_TOXCA|nr:hypothetical protein Tcan_12196 [Toxocara canis]
MKIEYHFFDIKTFIVVPELETFSGSRFIYWMMHFSGEIPTDLCIKSAIVAEYFTLRSSLNAPIAFTWFTHYDQKYPIPVKTPETAMPRLAIRKSKLCHFMCILLTQKGKDFEKAHCSATRGPPANGNLTEPYEMSH